jgi:RNA polymerase sigma-70 factor (ECF subfamily)
MENDVNSKESLQDLMKQAQNGDTEAYAALYRQFYTPVFKYIYQRVICQETAEDLAQTVFLKVFQSLQRFTDKGVSPLAYFFAIARNAVIDWSRKQAREFQTDPSDTIFETIEEQHEIPPQKMKQKEKHHIVIKAMEQLSPDQRDALTFRFMSGLKNSEISNIMGKSEALVRQLQCRGIKHLKTLSHLQYYL